MHGPAQTGNSWDDYELAFKAIRKAGSSPLLAQFATRQATSAVHAEVEMLLKSRVDIVDLVRAGVKRTLSINPHARDQIQSGSLSLLELQQIAYVVASRARLEIEAGNPVEGAEIFLDLCRFASDTTQNGPLISEYWTLSIYEIVLQAIRDLIDRKRGDLSWLKNLELALANLDAEFIQHDSTLINELAFTGHRYIRKEVLVRGGPYELHPPQMTEKWNYLFSDLLVIADAFRQLEYYLRLLAKCESLSWHDAQVEYDHILQETKLSSNPVIKYGISRELVYSGRSNRERRAQLRLLRAMAHYLASGTFIELADPFGGTLHQSTDGQVVKIWSVSENGTDDGGEGDWMSGQSKDLVFKLTK